MRTLQLGAATVSAIGGGNVCLATSASRGIPARELEIVIHEAIALGISLFDIAADADSEKLAGEAVRSQRARDRVVIATRVPLLEDRAGDRADPRGTQRPGAPARDALRLRLPMPYLQARVEASLRASRLEVLPLVQLPLRPAWLASPSWPELVGTCARLVGEGKVQAWGAWLDEPGEPGEPGEPDEPDEPDERAPAAAALIAEPWLAALSVDYHLCDRRAEPLFGPAAQRSMAVLARCPLAGGALAGGIGPGVRLTPRDDRNAIDPAALERIAIGVARLAALVKQPPPAASSCDAARQAGERAARDRPEHLECSDVAELALRSVLDRGAIALPRLHRREHLLAGMIAAGAPPRSADLVARVDQIFGPSSPTLRPDLRPGS